MNIKEVSEVIYANNVEKGFWEGKRNVGEMLMLVTSELAEALEADRKDRHASVHVFCKNTDGLELDSSHAKDYFKQEFEVAIKDTFEDEIADAVIRLFDISHGLGIDLQFHIEQKMKYNKLRPHKHGKAY